MTVAAASLEQVEVKGRIAHAAYGGVTLAAAFSKASGSLYDRRSADQALGSLGNSLPGLTSDVVDKLFPSGIPRRPRYPRRQLVMDHARPEKINHNLCYQDTRLKLAVEDKLGSGRSNVEYERDAQILVRAMSILLHTTGIYDHALWQDLTDNDLDALSFAIISAYDPNRRRVLLERGHEANRRALGGLQHLGPVASLTLDRLISLQLFAGIVWWLEIAEDFPVPKEGAIEINDAAMLKRDLLSLAGHLVFLFDDNGELVWDLALIQRLLHDNSRLQITAVVNTQIVANNANEETLARCLGHPQFSDLSGHPRFKIFGEDNPRSAIDLAYCSQQLIDRLETADRVYVKGVSFFETIQGLPVDTYYGFVVHSEDSQLCTGLSRGSGVLARVPAGESGYEYGRRTLLESRRIFASHETIGHD